MKVNNFAQLSGRTKIPIQAVRTPQHLILTTELSTKCVKK